MKHEDEVHRGPHLKDAKSREGKSQSLHELLNRKYLRAHVQEKQGMEMWKSLCPLNMVCVSLGSVEGAGGLNLPGACQTPEHISPQSNSEVFSDLLSLNLSSLWI